MNLFLFAYLSLSEFIRLNNDNWREVINDPKYEAIMYFFYNPSCPHCKHMKPIWESYYKNNDNITGLLNAEVKCDGRSRACDAFDIRGIPQFIFQDKINKINRTIGSHPSEAELKQIITERVFAHIHEVANFDEFNKNISNLTEPYTYFLLTTPNDDKYDYKKVFNAVASNFKQKNCEFYRLTDKKYSLTIYKHGVQPHNVSFRPDKENITNIVKRYLYPIFPPIEETILDLSRKNATKLVLVLLKDKNQIQNYMKVASDLLPNWQLVYAIYHPNSFIGRSITLQTHQLPAFALLKNNKWHLYHGNLTNDELLKYKVVDNSKSIKMFLIIAIGIILVALVVIQSISAMLFCPKTEESNDEQPLMESSNYDEPISSQNE